MPQTLCKGHRTRRQRLVRPYEHVKHVRNFKAHSRHWRPCGRIFKFCKFWKKKEIEPFDVISEDSSPKGFFWPNKINSVISLLSAASRYFRTYALNEPKTEKAILFLKLNSRSMLATSCFGSLSTLLYTSDLKWHWPALEIFSCTPYLGIALAKYFSSSSLVLRGLNLHSAICFAKQRVRSELTNS